MFLQSEALHAFNGMKKSSLKSTFYKNIGSRRPMEDLEVISQNIVTFIINRSLHLLTIFNLDWFTLLGIYLSQLGYTFSRYNFYI